MIREDAARAWVRDRPYVDAVTMQRIETVVAKIVAESGRQNLIAPSTLDSIWQRHVQDSLQLADLAGAGGRWLDIGSGGGFPGLILAMLDGLTITCVEPRRIRAQFLEQAAEGRCSVVMGRVEALKDAPFDVITARAVAAPSAIIAMSRHLAHEGTRWALPAGRSAMAELDRLQREWHGVFHVEQSLTSDDAGIIIVDRLEGRRR